MDLVSWGQKIVDTMTGVLDGEKRLVDAVESNHQKFQVQDNIEGTFSSIVSRGLNGEEKWKNLFSKLSSNFEAGFLLGSNHGQWTTLDTFVFGKRFAPPKNQRIYFGHKLPALRVGQIARARGPAVLQSFHLDGIQELKESSAFLIRVSPQYSYLLVCNRPGPWQQIFMEKFYDQYLKL